ncbi:molybdenum ABC transporter permease [Thiomicrospira sp. XS5]|jgi:molybdate transport system permease protein|uniref:molybdate ABC transporter permease subunit n=1 Tax=Thiomicrospira sp. XS5 TaxID=1775636 RepID=UPI0007483FAC|nr:molybdate ABC transporter permease subunit [Thiomicrospira sp. XS5]KUJ75705.1 molybdenum ABC transporter permease [Thiomicrospira sp. XS5]
MLEIFGTEINLQPIWLTLEVATMTTIVLLVLGTPLAWWMAQMRSSNKVFLEALVALPLVLPPTVLGFYLLILFNPNGTVTEVLRWFGFEGQLTFSKTGLVIGSVFYSLPFAIQPLMHAFENIPHRLLDAAATMRASFLDRFWTIVLPLSRRGILVAATLSFAHTVGEFGVVLMVGGNIPGETRMVSIDIFDHVESLEYDQAHILSAMMLIFALTVLMLVYGLNRRFGVKVG